MNLSSSIDFDLKRFFRWWGRELTFWIPEKLRKTLSDRTGYVFLTVAEDIIKIEQIIEDEKKNVDEFVFDEQGLAQYHELFDNDPELSKAYCILRLNSDQALKKILHLPAEAKENLEQVVAYEMDKYTPFRAEQVYFSIKQLEKGQKGQIKVLVVLTPREILDAIYLQLNSAQIYPDIVDYEGAANNFVEDLETYSLLPEWEKPVKSKITQTFIWLLCIATLLITIAVLVFPVWYESHRVDSLKEQIASLESDARFVQNQQLEMDEMVEETERLNNIKQNSPSTIELINSLSGLIRDNTWFTHLQFKDESLQIQGQSPTAESLISVLEESPLFSNARFVSPLTKDKTSGMERFQINVNVIAQGGERNE